MNYHPKWVDVTSGAPKVSLFGHSFAEYIQICNPDVAHSFVKLFAGDTKLFIDG